MLLRQMGFVVWGVMLSARVFADCGGLSQAEVQKHFAEAQKYESAGDMRKALSSYVLAQGYVCEGNSVEQKAAAKAAVLAKRLAPNLEKEDQLQEALETYEAGAYYREADRVMQALLEKNPDDTGLYDQAVSHFGNRSLASFQQNNRVRIAITGEYRADADAVKKLQARPAAAVARLLKRETEILSDDFLRDMAQLDTKMHEAASNPVLLMQVQQEQVALQGRWGSDRFEDSLRLLHDAMDWTSRIQDPKARDEGVSKVNGCRIARGDQLLKVYASAPTVLEHAQDYYRDAQADGKLAQLQVAARKLGDTALKNNRSLAAAAYFELAGEDEKAEQARARHNEQGMQNFDMNAYMQEMARQAQSPQNMQQIQALQKQMEEMMRNAQPAR